MNLEVRSAKEPDIYNSPEIGEMQEAFLERALLVTHRNLLLYFPPAKAASVSKPTFSLRRYTSPP
jgi:hypothetical protein